MEILGSKLTVTAQRRLANLSADKHAISCCCISKLPNSSSYFLLLGLICPTKFSWRVLMELMCPNRLY